MSKSSRLVFLTLVAAAFTVSASTAFAVAPGKKTPPFKGNSVVRESVSWVLPAGQCAEAPAGLQGTGDRHMVINTKLNHDGSTTTIINDVVKGTATDLGGGGSYGFIYQNHSVEVEPVSGAHQVSMEDNFVLNGKGNIKHLAVGFNWRWTYTPPDDFFSLDNLVQNSTRGDPFACDPL